MGRNDSPPTVVQWSAVEECEKSSNASSGNLRNEDSDGSIHHATATHASSQAHMGLFILLMASSIPSTGVTKEQEAETASRPPRNSALRFMLSVPSEPAPVAVLSHSKTLSFLTLGDLLRLRGTNRSIAATVQAKKVIVYPGGEVFIRWDTEIVSQDTAAQRVAAPRTLLWDCASCGGVTSSVRPECTRCGAWQSLKTSRLFLGQLRRRDTVLVVVWMLTMLLPTVAVSHIDNHTNPRDAARGRGCAWLYVDKEHEDKVRALHKRILFDQSPLGSEEDGEGFWLVPNLDACRQQLSEFAETRTGRDLVLPRRTLVVEVATGGKSSAGIQHNSQRHVSVQHHVHAMPPMQFYQPPPPPCGCPECVDSLWQQYTTNQPPSPYLLPPHTMMAGHYLPRHTHMCSCPSCQPWGY